MQFTSLWGNTSSQKPHIKTDVLLTNDVIVLHPTDSYQSHQNPLFDDNESTTVTGEVKIVSEPWLNVQSIRVGFLVLYRLKVGDAWTERFILEIYHSFEPEEIVSSLSDNGKYIKRVVDFTVSIPSHLATFEKTSSASVVSHIRAIVTFGFNSQSSDQLARKLKAGFSKEEKLENPSWSNLIQDSFAQGLVHRPFHDDSRQTEFIADPRNPSQVNKIIQITKAHVAVVAHPDPTYGTYKLRVKKEGSVGGMGSWSAFLWSDAFSIASTLLARFHIPNPPANFRLYHIILSVMETTQYIEADDFLADNQASRRITESPKEIILTKAGMIQSKRPGRAHATLFKGDQAEGEGYLWESEKMRLPDGKTFRPSTNDGTSTPIVQKHTIRIKVFYSLEGLTLDNQPIVGEDETGDLRMLVLTLPVTMPSCCCTAERVKLPEYEQLSSSDLKEKKKAPFCACCYHLDDFPDPAFPDEWIERGPVPKPEIVSPVDDGSVRVGPVD